MTTAINTPVIPGYQIKEQLYTGSKTIVYRAIREKDSKAVVIKFLASEYPSFNELLQFRNQYVISKNLNNPGIIRPLSLDVYGNGYILVMEDTGGMSLREYIKITTLSLVEFLALAIQLTDILNGLHHNRVIHKDIKPANILIHPETKQVQLIDFSIASLLPRETQEIKNPNVLEGTLAYLSPEQTGRMNRGVDYRSDFYSLGVTFYELLTGELPFISNDPMELVHCHIAQINALSVTEDVVDFMAQQLQKLPAETQEILKLAACIGNQFDLNTLAIVSEKSEALTAAVLWKALQEGIILPQSDVYKFYLSFQEVNVNTNNIENAGYRFLHDRVQQAAYSLIPDDQKQITHYQIGQLLQQRISPEAIEDYIFEVINQLNYGTSLINEQNERDGLNFISTVEKKRLLLVTCKKHITAMRDGELKLKHWI